jgi:hypothetical protein
MVIVVKRGKNKLVAKIIFVIFMAVMFFVYFLHMNEKFAEFNTQDDKKKFEAIENPLALKYENDIIEEVDKAIRLLDRKSLKEISVEGDILSFRCDINSDIDAIKIRYKDLLNLAYENSDIIISVDIKEVLEIKYNEE